MFCVCIRLNTLIYIYFCALFLNCSTLQRWSKFVDALYFRLLLFSVSVMESFRISKKTTRFTLQVSTLHTTFLHWEVVQPSNSFKRLRLLLNNVKYFNIPIHPYSWYILCSCPQSRRIRFPFFTVCLKSDHTYRCVCVRVSVCVTGLYWSF